jgi:hypothetical protein
MKHGKRPKAIKRQYKQFKFLDFDNPKKMYMHFRISPGDVADHCLKQGHFAVFVLTYADLVSMSAWLCRLLRCVGKQGLARCPQATD